MKKTFNGSLDDEVVARPRMMKEYTTKWKTLILCLETHPNKKTTKKKHL